MTKVTIQKVLMVESTIGNGVLPDDPYRVLRSFYSRRTLQPYGEIDSWQDSSDARNTAESDHLDLIGALGDLARAAQDIQDAWGKGDLMGRAVKTLSEARVYAQEVLNKHH